MASGTLKRLGLGAIAVAIAAAAIFGVVHRCASSSSDAPAISAYDGGHDAGHDTAIAAPAYTAPEHDAELAAGGIAWSRGIVATTPEARSAQLHAALARTFGFAGDYRPRRCIAIWGQSNAAGRKFIEQVTAPQHDLLISGYANVKISEWEATKTSPLGILYDTLHQVGTQSPISPNNRGLAPRPYALVPDAIPNMGAELSLGHGLDPYAPNQLGVIKCAVGATSLATEWCTSCNFPTTGPPNLYNTCRQYTIDAAASMGCHVALMLWIQGEQDACGATTANPYQTNLSAFFASVRQTWPNLPILLNRLSSAFTGCGDASTLATIRAAQVGFVGATAKTAWVNDDDLLLDSGIHFIPDAYVTLGYRLAPAAINALGYAIPPTASFKFQAQTRTANFTDTSVDPNVGSQANPAIGGSVTSWSWDFGDSSTSSAQNPSHTYAADGAYAVKLIVRNSAGVPAALTQTITVASPTWATDATSGIGVMASSSDWTAFETAHQLTAFGTPADGYLFQQASGTIGDVLAGAKTLSIAGAPTYSKAIAGWTRKAVGGSGAAQGQSASNAAMANINASSWLVEAYIRHDASTGGNRPILSLGGSAVSELETAGSTGAARLRNGANSINGTAAITGSTVHPVIVLYDRANSRNCIFTDVEKICATFTSAAGTSLINQFSTTADTTFSDFLWEARWEGSAAERSDAEIKHLLNAEGWAPSWQLLLPCLPLSRRRARNDNRLRRAA